MQIGVLVDDDFFLSDVEKDLARRTLEGAGFHVRTCSFPLRSDVYHGWKVDAITALGAIRFMNALNKVDFDVPYLPAYSPEFHAVSSYIGQLPQDRLWNKRASMLPLSVIQQRSWENLWSESAVSLFVKPDNALKVAEPCCVTQNNYRDVVSNWLKFTGLHSNSLCWLSPEALPAREYRALVEQGKVLSISPYAHQGQDKVCASESLKPWLEDALHGVRFNEDVFIVDVAEGLADERGILELNCLSSSGHYDLNKIEIAASLCRFVQRQIDYL